MKAPTHEEVDIVSGAISSDAAYGGAIGVAAGLLGIGLAVTAPVWRTAFLPGGSLLASGVAIHAVFFE